LALPEGLPMGLSPTLILKSKTKMPIVREINMWSHCEGLHGTKLLVTTFRRCHVENTGKFSHFCNTKNRRKTCIHEHQLQHCHSLFCS